MIEVKETIQEIVRRTENQYISDYTLISEYVDYSQWRTINTIDAYLNSKHISGDVDDLGREKPFFDICTAAVNIWYRATDIDRKDIRIVPTNNKSRMPAFLLNLHLQQWMRQERFGQFLNKWGRTLAEYGSAVAKFVEKDGRLVPTVVPWNRLMSDPINFTDNIKIEVLEMTAAQLKENPAYDQDMVDSLIDCEGTARESLNQTQKDTKSYYYKVYEVHGKFSNATLKMAQGKEPSDSDFDTFSQQLHAVSFVAQKEGKYTDFTLYSGKEKEDPYMITSLIEQDGRALGIGAVEHLFEAQWMANHSQKLIKDQLDLASKVIFQTPDPTYVGQNAISDIETGDVLTYDINKGPLTKINNDSQDISNIQNWQTQWTTQAKEIDGTPDAISGNTMPSGTAYRQVAILNQEANSLFELMQENKGLGIEDIIRDRVMPFIMRNLKHSEEITADLGDYGVKEIEDTYVKNEAIDARKKMAKDILLNPNALQDGQLSQPIPGQQDMEAQIKDQLSQNGNVRFISPDTVTDKQWKQLFKDIEYNIQVEITNEQNDKQATLDTLNTLFTNIVNLQGRPMTDEEKLVFNEILDTTGIISPVQLDSINNKPSLPPQPVPAQAQPVAPPMTTPAATP